MAYVAFLLDDKHASDSAWAVLAGGANRRRILELRDAYTCLKAAAGEEMTDGYLTAERISTIAYLRVELVDVLCRAVLGRAPKVHRRGEECDCLPRGWPDDFDFYIHEFLKGNPTRKSKKLRDAKKDDSRDRPLRALVLKRDKGYCRYCWSGPLNSKAAGRAKDRRVVLEYDHVDPGLPAGADGTNYAVACDRCQDEKRDLTPELANMALLPIPTDEQISRFPHNHAGGRTVFDRPDQMSDHPFNQRPISDPISDRSAEPINGAINDPITDRSVDPISDPIDDPRPEVRQRSADQHADHDRLLSGSGRVGHPGDPAHDPSLEQWRPEARPASNPDVYTKQSRPPPVANAPPGTGPPKDVWLGTGKRVDSKRACRFCGTLVPAGREIDFCSQTCINEFHEM